MFQKFVGCAITLIGLGFAVPAIVTWRELGEMPLLGLAMFMVGALLMASGLGAVTLGRRESSGLTIPRSVIVPLTVNALALGFFALEISDGLARRQGTLHPFSLALLLPASVLY